MNSNQNIADLNKRITLQYQASTPNGQGGFVKTWVSVTPDLWAGIWPVSAKEVVQDNQTAWIISHRIRIRYRRGVKVTHRIKYKNRYFNLVSVINPNEDCEWLDLLAKETA